MPIIKIKERLDELSQRERLLLFILAGAICLSFVAVSALMVLRKISEFESIIENNENILQQLKQNIETIQWQVQVKKEQERRFTAQLPQLSGLLEKLGGEAGIEIPESHDLQDEIIDKKWIHKSVEIKLRKIGLDALVAFMVKIKNQNKNFPIAITKLNIRKRMGETNSFDIQMTVSAYTLKEKKERIKSGKENSGIPPDGQKEKEGKKLIGSG
ncbi:MAG: hypothetical protein NC830_02080 [Candidatus Omnitrophica bacterium]|nr:hypothetical protein [Candidatus Omnitrophota bacterium]